MRYALDTDVCIRIIRNRPFLGTELETLLATHAGELSASTVVMTELLHGAAMSPDPAKERNNVTRLLARLTVLDFDADAAEHAADIKADLQRKGRMIGANDILIAGHARSRALTVVTGNLREFERVEGLRVEDWPAGPMVKAGS